VSKFTLKSNFKPVLDQIAAIRSLVKGISKNQKYQVLLGVTGSGKTFTIANVIEKLQMPTLIISHNKTLAAQLYQEFREFFPQNSVNYFVSYYDYYQPEAYIPSTDTYIEKDSSINELIDKLRLQTTANLLTRKDCIVIASVSCIYNIGSPVEYGNFVLPLKKGQRTSREELINELLSLQYERADFNISRGTFRITGDTISIFPAYTDNAVNIELSENSINAINLIHPVTGKILENLKKFILYPSKHFITNPAKNKKIFREIRKDLQKRIQELKTKGKSLEAHRLKQKVTYDLEMIEELGYTKGIENYSRYFDGRMPGDPPHTLISYFNESFGNNWLLVVDESHMTFPQIRGMHAGDQSRKQTLIDYGFRLPSALDNRPLKFEEFMRLIPRFIATSATPSDWELSMAGKKNIVEQLLRPTGIPDPKVEIRPTKDQIQDCIKEIKKRSKKGQRTLVTTLTKKTAEDISDYLINQGIKAQYLHSDIKTLDRSDTLEDLRRGKYDAIIGINLLREGLDLPEVSLVAILDADKEGFLRNDVTLIQTMGRAARHIEGEVILYADTITGSIERALKEVRRRRKYQLKINKKYNITPKKIVKPIRETLIERDKEEIIIGVFGKSRKTLSSLPDINIDNLTPMDKKRLIKNLKREMRLAANDLNFELAIKIRDKIRKLDT